MLGPGSPGRSLLLPSVRGRYSSGGASGSSAPLQARATHRLSGRNIASLWSFRILPLNSVDTYSQPQAQRRTPRLILHLPSKPGAWVRAKSFLPLCDGTRKMHPPGVFPHLATESTAPAHGRDLSSNDHAGREGVCSACISTARKGHAKRGRKSA